LIDTDYLIQGALLGFLECMGIGIALAILMSVRHARTEAGHFFYSPTYKPTRKTPKVVFLPLPLLVSTLLVIIGIRDVWHSVLDARAVVISQILLWIIGIGCVVQVALFIVTTEPVGDDPPDNDARPR
jgi:hypothetical protein